MILQKATIVKWRAVFRKENRSFSYVNQIDISSGWIWMFSFEHPLYLQSRPQWSRVENKLLLEPRWWPVASCTRWATCKCRSDNPWEVRRSKRDLFDLITNEQERKREGEENVGFERSSTDPGGQVGDKEGAKMGYGSIDSVQVISNLAYCAFYVYKHW